MSVSTLPPPEVVGRRTAGDIANSSYKKPAKQREIASKYGYNIDSNLSKGHTRVWRQEGKPSVIVHRGTRTARDVVDDGLIALGLGKHTHRYKDAERVTKRVRKADQEAGNGQGAIHVGHSLGGYLAEQSGRHGSQVYTYNKHAIGATGSTLNRNQTDIRTPGDLVSLPSLFKPAEKTHRRYTEGISGILAPFRTNTLINPLYAHKTNRKSRY